MSGVRAHLNAIRAEPRTSIVERLGTMETCYSHDATIAFGNKYTPFFREPGELVASYRYLSFATLYPPTLD